VLHHECVHRRFERPRVDRAARREQHALVPVRRLSERPVEEPLLHRPDRITADRRYHRRCRNVGPASCHGRQFRERRVLEHIARRQLQPRRACLRHDLDRQDRVAAEFEKSLRCTDALAAQHLAPDPRQCALVLRRGSTNPAGAVATSASSDGSARRSTLPVGVIGHASTATNCAGIM